MATFFNQATLSYSGGTVNSNIATGEIVEVLSATKTAIVDNYTTGSDVSYIVNIINSGDSAFTGLTVTDDLGQYTVGTTTLQPFDYVDGSVKYFINGVLQPDPIVTAGPPLAISGITVPANSQVSILYTATANSFAPPISGGTVTNTVTVNGGGITPIIATETVTAQNAPNLTITKTASPTTVTENGRLTYTFVIQNTGNTEATATDNIVITDTFNPILTDLVVTYNGATWTETTNYTYNETTGLFSTVAGNITVPAATYTQDPVTGVYTIDPGVATITVTGTV